MLDRRPRCGGPGRWRHGDAVKPVKISSDKHPPWLGYIGNEILPMQLDGGSQ